MPLLKSKITKILGVVVVGAVIIAVFVRRGDSTLPYEFIIAERGPLIQEVSVTGKIKPAQSVDLQFENSGKISSLNADVGDNVFSGQSLASLDTAEAGAQVLEKEAALELARADLQQTINDFNSLNDPAIRTALKTDLDNAETNLANVKQKAGDDLASAYGDAFNTMNEAMIQADTSFSVLKSLRRTYFDGSDQDSRDVQEAENDASLELYGLVSHDRLGAKDYVDEANSDDTNENINAALDKLEEALAELKSAYSVLQTAIKENLSKVSTTDRDKANSEASAVASRLSLVSSAIQDIRSQKITNSRNISDAQSELDSAKAAFPTQEDIIKKQAAVKQAEANLLASQAQLNKLIISAPFSGTITKVEVEEGETVSSNDIIVSLISDSGFQIEANVTEVDIAKVGLNNRALFTLDAYGADTQFEAFISKIDPAETVIDGVTTYEVSLQFNEDDFEIKPNLTANIDIITARKDNVIAIPQRAVITKNGAKFVNLIINDQLWEVEVQTGLQGTNGMVEIQSGINEGDKVVTFIEK